MFHEWDTQKKSWADVRKSMLDTIGSTKDVSVFELPAKFTKHITNAYSFALSYEKGYKYSSFLDKFENESFNAKVAMK